MKTFNIFCSVIFVVFAILQYNDPDPYLWIPIYLYPAVLCGLAASGRYFPKAFLAGIIVFSVYALYKVFDQNGLLDWLTEHNAENIAASMKAAKPWIEESREFFGLLIIVIALFINYLKIRKRNRLSAL